MYFKTPVKIVKYIDKLKNFIFHQLKTKKTGPLSQSGFQKYRHLLTPRLPQSVKCSQFTRSKPIKHQCSQFLSGAQVTNFATGNRLHNPTTSISSVTSYKTDFLSNSPTIKTTSRVSTRSILSLSPENLDCFLFRRLLLELGCQYQKSC